MHHGRQLPSQPKIMKIIKTYWPTPEGPDRQAYYLKIKREPLYLFGLSSLLLLKHHSAELYTDAEGAKIIDQLSIPFSKINVVEKVSATYKSVNDLHVLSLQQGPAALVDDNLLTMGKIDFNFKQDTINVLGIDLNSMKLVKAIIKTMRIDKNIPFLDDTLWNKNKMAYIDTALMITANNDVIKDYYSEVQQFINRHAGELLKIDNSVIEDLFIRYWLYSYCKIKGIEFENYYKDPMEVIQRDINHFGFSNKNITQNFLKVRDHYASDPIFSLHFIRFFQLHFKETLQAIEQFEKRSVTKSTKTGSYLRTKQLYLRMYPEIMKQKKTGKNGSALAVKNIKSSIRENAVDNQSRLLKDIYHFDTTVNKIHKHYLQDKDSIRKQQNAAFEKILQYWDITNEEFDYLRIAINPYFFFTESGWKWNIRWLDGVPVEKVAELKVIYNSSLDPAYFIAGFIPDPEKDTAFEFNIDKMTAEIIDYFSNESTIADFCHHLFSQTEKVLEETERIALRQTYHNRIKDLLLINILQINA